MDVQVIELLVQVNQGRAEILQDVEGHRRIVDESPRFTGRRDLPADDHIVLIVEVILFEELLNTVAAHVEVGLHHTFVLQVVKRFDVRPLAHNKPQGAQQNGFTGAGLPGYNG